MKKRRALFVVQATEPALVARHMGEAITYLISVARSANLPRLALLLGRVRGELLSIEVSGQDLQNADDQDPSSAPDNPAAGSVRRQQHSQGRP